MRLVLTRMARAASKRYHSSLNNSLPDYGYATFRSASGFTDILISPVALPSKNTKPSEQSEPMVCFPVPIPFLC